MITSWNKLNICIDFTVVHTLHPRFFQHESLGRISLFVVRPAIYTDSPVIDLSTARKNKKEFSHPFQHGHWYFKKLVFDAVDSYCCGISSTTAWSWANIDGRTINFFPNLNSIIYEKCVVTTQFSFWILIALAKVCFFHIVINRAKILLY